MTILDTNVLSELMKPQPSPQVSSWIARQVLTEIFTTSITEAEIFLGIELLAKGRRREGLLEAAEAIFAKDLGNRVIGFGSDAARLFAKIIAHRRSLGKPIDYADAQIASVARLQKAKLATRNVADFSDCGIDTVNPWEDA